MGAELIGIAHTAQDASKAPLSGGLCGGGRGLSAIDPVKVAAAIRMSAERADALMRLAVTDAQVYNNKALAMYAALADYPQQQEEFLPIMTSTQMHQDQCMTDVLKDAVFSTTLSEELLGTDDELTFTVIPASGPVVGETLA